jgi:hypothetical protein
MSTTEGLDRIVVVGSTSGAGKDVDPFADAVAGAIRASRDLSLSGVIGPGAPFPTAGGLVLALTAPNDRVGVVRNAVAANLPVATLPLPDSGESVWTAVQSGRVVQVSPLRGFEALDTLYREMRRGVTGRTFGIFAAHRVRQGQTNLFEEVGLPLLHYAYDLLGEPVSRAQVTRASLFGGDGDAWFVLLRSQSGLLATVEFAASLPREAGPNEQILVEVTGSDGVLRAEPTRQAVAVYGDEGGSNERGWWSTWGLAREFLRAALDAAKEHDATRERGFFDLLAAVHQSADSGQPVELH